MSFNHGALKLAGTMPLVFAAHSKHYFYFRMFISKYVLEQGAVPLNPFMMFDFFMLDTVERNTVRRANNSALARADELWVFGPIADGVFAEIMQAQEQGKPVRYFAIVQNTAIVSIASADVEMEPEVAAFKHMLTPGVAKSQIIKSEGI